MSIASGKLLFTMFAIGAEGFVTSSTSKNYNEPRFSTELNSIYKDNKFDSFEFIKKRVNILKNSAVDFVRDLFREHNDKQDKEDENDFFGELQNQMIRDKRVGHQRSYHIYKDDEERPNEGRGEHIEIPEKFVDKIISAANYHKSHEKNDIQSTKQLMKAIDKDKKKPSFVQRLEDSMDIGDDWMSLDDDCMSL